MTTPGDPSETPQTGDDAAPSEGVYEAPPIEQTPGQPSYQPPPSSTPPGYLQGSGYPPPSYPPPGYTPPPSYPPPPEYGSTAGASYPPPLQQPPYQPSGYSGGYGQQSNTNTMAIWSLVSSLIGIVCGLGSIVGIVLGAIALNQIKQTRQGGYGLAVAGIAVGVVSLIISIFWYTFAFSH